MIEITLICDTSDEIMLVREGCRIELINGTKQCSRILHGLHGFVVWYKTRRIYKMFLYLSARTLTTICTCLDAVVNDCWWLHLSSPRTPQRHFDTTKAGYVYTTPASLSCRHEKYSCQVWTETAQKWNNLSRYEHRSMNRRGLLAEEGLVLNSNSQNTRTAVYFRAFSTWRLRRQIFPRQTMNWIFFFVVRLCSSLNVNMRVSVGKEQRQSTTRQKNWL